MIRLCAAINEALRARTVPHLRIVDENIAQRGDGFTVFMIGATVTRNLLKH